MTTDTITKSLSQLGKLHHSLLLVSEQKTEALKDGDITLIQKLLLQERKLVQAINQIEMQRQLEVGKWAVQHGMKQEQATISNLLETIPDLAEKESLEKHYVSLADTIVRLKQQEQLNQQLMQQSLQFIELSIDMLDPSAKNLNYNQRPAEQTPSQPRSMFDSRA